MDKFDEKARAIAYRIWGTMPRDAETAMIAQALRDAAREAREEDIEIVREVCSQYANAKERGAIYDAPDPEPYSSGVLMGEIVAAIRAAKEVMPTATATADTPSRAGPRH